MDLRRSLSVTTAWLQLRERKYGQKKRERGQHLQEKKDGLWAAQYLVDTPDGKTYRKYVSGKKRKKVAEKLAYALKERGEGAAARCREHDRCRVLTDWMDSGKESVRESTQARREQVLRFHVYPNIGHLRLGKLNALHVQRLYVAKLDEGLSPGTVRLIHGARERSICPRRARAGVASSLAA